MKFELKLIELETVALSKITRTHIEKNFYFLSYVWM